uniref:Adiponectin receptor 2 n=1 Tax=Bos taurus TaxID=9913 RepID=A0AAA9SXS6_BOVIN
MNETEENRLEHSKTPEPALRLRKGHQLDGARNGDSGVHHGGREPLVEASVLSSYHKKSVEERECDDGASQEDEGFMGMSPLLQAHHAMERMEEFVCKVWEGRWRVIPHDVLPEWLKDNDFLLHGHRPPMPSFRACFKSIFRIHTETGNIWTHLLGCVFFLCLGIFYMFRPNISFVAPLQEKVVFGLFFLGAILCLSFSWLFHTVYCHSEGVSRIFSKLDYSGIALLIMGSFVPWLYYSFYCNPQPCFIYLIVICVLGIAAIIVSQWDMFATPQYRGVRAGVFLGLGLSGIIPTLHYVISEGFLKAATIGQIGWLLLMAGLYITGAALYAARIPERFFPGKCDIWESRCFRGEPVTRCGCQPQATRFQVQDTDTTCTPCTSRSPLPGRPAERREWRPPQGFCVVLPSVSLPPWGPQSLGSQVGSLLSEPPRSLWGLSSGTSGGTGCLTAFWGQRLEPQRIYLTSSASRSTGGKMLQSQVRSVTRSRRLLLG